MSAQEEYFEALARLDSLRARWDGCTGCELRRTRQNVVMWRGHPRARLAVIGEAPGEREDIEGEPFVGRAGKLFDELCDKVAPVGPEPWTYFIANTVGCRPPNNRRPTVEEWRACYPRLFAMLAIVQPKAILLLGATALTFLTGWRSVEKRRGAWLRVEFEWRRRQVVIPALATYHPAFLLRDPSATPQVIADIRMAWDKAQPGSWLEGD